jgi:hypothetical protein
VLADLVLLQSISGTGGGRKSGPRLMHGLATVTGCSIPPRIQTTWWRFALPKVHRVSAR